MTTRTKPSSSKFSKKQQLQLLRIVTHIGALLPLLLLIIDFYTNDLGADPIRELTFRTGKPAIILLILSLACTPLSIVGWKIILPLRKPLGLYSFMYVCFHLGIFVFSYGYFGQAIEWLYVWQEATQRRYAVVGLLAFLILLPLALTSTNWAMRKLGKNWKRLHRLVYVAAVLAVVHYFWLIKGDYGQPILFAVILGLLFLIRTPPVKERLTNWRKRSKAAARPRKERAA
jgi:sulfoxide reductase heme-binding subunit YedZ